jgi:hypothetical protein
MFGEASWWLLISGIIINFFYGSVMFLFVRSETSVYALGMLAAGIGVSMAWILKKVVLSMVMKACYLVLF